MADPAVPTLTAPASVIDALLAGEQVIDLRVQPAAGGPSEGATRFVVVRALTEAADPAAVAAELRRLLDTGR